MFFITAGARFASPNWASGVISDMRPVRKKKKNFLVHRQSTLGPPLLTTPKGRSAGVLVMSNGRGARVVVAFDFAPPPVGGIYVGRRHPGAVDLILLAPGSSNIWASPKLNLPP